MAGIRYLTRYAVSVILVLGMVGLVWAAEGQTELDPEKKIAKKDLPAAVLSAFQTAYPTAEITGTNEETADSTTYFEIESRDHKVERTVLYAANGTVKEIEEIVSKAELPAAIKDAVAKEFPKGKIQKGEKITRDNTVEYELIVKVGKDKMVVVLDDTGKIVKTEPLSEEEEKD